MAVFRLTTTERSLREAVAVDAPSSDVIVDPGVRPTVRMLGFAAPGRAVQYTTSPEANINAGTAIWIDWIAGSVSGIAEGRAMGAITGIRLSPGGPGGTWEIVA